MHTAVDFGGCLFSIFNKKIHGSGIVAQWLVQEGNGYSGVWVLGKGYFIVDKRYV